MSTLVLMLTAAMAVPGNGPEMVSAEMEEGLDLRGRWEGIWHLKSHRVRSVEVWPVDGWLEIHAKDDDWFHMVKPRDEGSGRASLNFNDVAVFPGIYRQDGDHIIICYREDGNRRPSSFRAGDGQELLILHRVKPRK
jgi:hypothetical protein